MNENKRHCTVCGAEMTQGYVIGEGEEYFCSDDCLHAYYSPKEYIEAFNCGNAYWTEFEE